MSLSQKIEQLNWLLISLIHGIEHFTAKEGRELMQDIYSVLAPGGKVILEQPNLEAAAQALLGLASFTGEWECSVYRKDMDNSQGSCPADWSKLTINASGTYSLASFSGKSSTAQAVSCSSTEE